jgi:hypothetical protein
MKATYCPYPGDEECPYAGIGTLRLRPTTSESVCRDQRTTLDPLTLIGEPQSCGSWVDGQREKAE